MATSVSARQGLSGRLTHKGAAFSMTAVVTIDQDVRARGRDTYVPFDDVIGGLGEGEQVVVVDRETGFVGDGRITSIDDEAKRVYVTIEWETLHAIPEAEPPAPGEGGGTDFESSPEKFGGRAMGPGGLRFEKPKPVQLRSADKTPPPG